MTVQLDIYRVLQYTAHIELANICLINDLASCDVWKKLLRFHGHTLYFDFQILSNQSLNEISHVRQRKLAVKWFIAFPYIIVKRDFPISNLCLLSRSCACENIKEAFCVWLGNWFMEQNRLMQRGPNQLLKYTCSSRFIIMKNDSNAIIMWPFIFIIITAEMPGPQKF